MTYVAYVICTTPRSGSTLLCELLTTTGVAGQPHSYFRRQDIADWARHWGVVGGGAIDDPSFNRAYLAAMRRVGMAATDLFGLRLMWDSVGEATARLDAAPGDSADLRRGLEYAFGPTLFIHLSRQDKIAQAVSMVRAEQTGLWHIAADGSEYERLAPPEAPIFDVDRIAQARDLLAAEDEQWSCYFDQNEIRPLRLTYEGLAANPQGTLAQILLALGCDPGAAEGVEPAVAKMADAISADWVGRMNTLVP